MLRRGIVSPRDWQEAREAAIALFVEGQRHAATRGLILVDTKYEFGRVGNQLVVIDEMHTPDSSRFWVAEGSQERFERGEPQRMLDKENLRQWLINDRGFAGHGPLPTIPDDVRVSLAEKYLTAYQQITGLEFSLAVGSVNERLERNLRSAKPI